MIHGQARHSRDFSVCLLVALERLQLIEEPLEALGILHRRRR
jgi:hypothetical protein